MFQFEQSANAAAKRLQRASACLLESESESDIMHALAHSSVKKIVVYAAAVNRGSRHTGVNLRNIIV